MRFIRSNLSALRPIRFLIGVCISALVVFSQAFPALSAPVNPTGSPTAPQNGQEELLDIEKEAQKAVLEKPYSLEETQGKANAGLNEIQGTADVNKMKRPENSDADSVEQKLKNVLEKATGRN
jgi:hypothetical protein